MTKEIEIDDDVFEALQELAEPFVDTPNTVIKRLLEQQNLLKTSGGHPAKAGLTLKPSGSGLINQAMQAGLTVESHKFYGGEKGLINGTVRAKVGEVTPQAKYEEWLLKALWKDFNGSAPKADVTEIVIKEMQDGKILKEIDFERVSTGEIRASNTIAWARNALKDQGYIKSPSKRGIWELTDEGIVKAKALLRG